MIPKIIHYCWFGRGEKPRLAQKCIASWKKYMPDYEIIEWNEDNLDIEINPYTKMCYEQKKYAFLTDYYRLVIVSQYGGIYFDTDVEVIKNMDDIIAKGPFMGCEKRNINCLTKSPAIAPGLGLGVTPGFPLYKDLLNVYDKKHLFSRLGKIEETIVGITTRLLEERGLVQDNEGIWHCLDLNIYPEEYFCPKNYYTGELVITPNTCSIHHYTATWHKNTKTFLEKLKNRLHLMYIRYSVFFQH